MDLTERGGSTIRHPWEVQRFNAYLRILADHGALGALQVLDVGAGDGWFSDRLAEHLDDDASVTCWDVNYDDSELEPTRAGQMRTREHPGGGHDLVLVLDVLEHIDAAATFVSESLVPTTDAGAPVLVAVPAHQRLFGAHDEALGHRRRYSRRRLLDELDPWLRIVEHGSLFTTLLLPRAISVGAERLRPASARRHGVGDWQAGRLATSVTNGVLASDVRFARAAGRVGIRPPGLSLWAFGVAR